MKNRNNTVKINKIILIGIVFLFAMIITKMLYISITNKAALNGMNLKTFASNRDTLKQTLFANRGTIYDVNGDVLAQNVNSYTVIAYLASTRTTNEKNPQHVVDKEYTAVELEKVFINHKINNMSKDYILSLLNSKIKSCDSNDNCTEKPPYQVELGPGGRGITELIKEDIEALDLPGIDFIQSTKRYYKMGNFASYVIGYSKKNDDGELVGEMGIEDYYDKELKGKNGYSEYQVDAYGYQIPNTPSNTDNPENGSDIYLTLDNTIQLKLESIIKELNDMYTMSWITFSVADAKTGAILATASSPNFNPNTLEIDSYLTPLTQYAYEPGSTMKIFSFMAAMENEVYKGDELYPSGTIKVGDITIKDFNGVGWGTITYDEGFAYSSNVAATKLAQKMGKAKLKNYYDLAGFGVKTGIELPNESAGKISFNYEVEVSNASFGQGILTTPIQTIQALTAISNNGVILKPYIVSKIVNPDTKEITYEAKKEEIKTIASQETVEKIKTLMYDVVYSGKTDAKYFKPNNVSLIGKTGTAQIASKNGGYLNGPYDYIRSFVGLFPAEDPQYIVHISVKQLVGSFKTVANKVADLVDDIASYKNITNIETEQEKVISMPNVINKSQEEGVTTLETLNLKTVVLGEGTKIINQYPHKNEKVNKNGIVLLLTNNDTYRMPNIYNWSSAEVKYLCNFINLKCQYDGYGYVTDYSIKTGEIITKKDNLTITFENIYDKYINPPEEPETEEN